MMGARCLIADGFQRLLGQSRARGQGGWGFCRCGTPGIQTWLILTAPSSPRFSMAGAARDEPHIWLLLRRGGLSAARAISVLNHDQ